MSRTLVGTPDPDPVPRSGFSVSGPGTTNTASGLWSVVSFTFNQYAEPDSPLKFVQSERLDAPRELEP